MCVPSICAPAVALATLINLVMSVHSFIVVSIGISFVSSAVIASTQTKLVGFLWKRKIASFLSLQLSENAPFSLQVPSFLTAIYALTSRL